MVCSYYFKCTYVQTYNSISKRKIVNYQKVKIQNPLHIDKNQFIINLFYIQKSLYLGLFFNLEGVL